MKDKPDITVIMPALNEEEDILAAIDTTLAAFKDFKIDGEIIVINDGSTDKTAQVVSKKIKGDNRLRGINHDSPLGIGASFWDGVDNARGSAVVLLPGDNENDPLEIFRYHKLLEHVDIVIPFVFNKGVRSLFRNTLSFIYRFIVNSTFTVTFNYTNGTVLYRKSILDDIEYRSKGFFFQTDILIRAVKKGYLFAEVPYCLKRRKDGVSKAVSFPSFINVVKGYLRLVRDYYFNKEIAAKAGFSMDSQTAIRRRVDDD